MKITSRLTCREAGNRVGIGAAVFALTGMLLGAPAVASEEPDQPLLDLINQQRAQAQPPCAPLHQNPQLQAAADQHAHDLATNGWRDNHIGSDGSTPFQRIDATGYRWKAAAENQAQNYSDQAVVTWWMNSPGHQANMLNCRYTDAGTASVSNNDGIYAVAVFAAPG
ncbi:SCP-like extracellular [Mycobacterium haemophilum DSM 44634]|uniref:CAP domain-containing protein n=1 Tax=Mycobacterium haemophilum TaxID=29311 RepID=UPI0006D3BE7C|nr:CAP domain-containing protein [Mycobacterium haemophilum]AKN18367.2 hypothetical protein B586_01535 [Mycobacterium haemophilum DSM 44634]MCV7342600.1 CAP domain-containing protein [Mycobacterium haemophilum DSM 44634]